MVNGSIDLTDMGISGMDDRWHGVPGPYTQTLTSWSPVILKVSPSIKVMSGPTTQLVLTIGGMPETLLMATSILNSTGASHTSDYQYGVYIDIQGLPGNYNGPLFSWNNPAGGNDKYLLCNFDDDTDLEQIMGFKWQRIYIGLCQLV